MGAALALAAVVIGFVFGPPVAGGADSYGYVSQAHLWATGRMREELRLVDELVPSVPADALVPLGYNLAADRRTIVPIYPAGLPLVMAAFERVAGPSAVFWVVPLLAGIAVWFTFVWGGSTAGPVAGVVAAALLAASPAFLFQLTTAPMSDLPTAAWWTLALALLFVDRRWAAPVAALGAALAILTRPNLVVVAIVPLALLFRRWVVAHRGTGDLDGSGALVARRRGRDLLVFALGVAIASIIVAAIYQRLYGSPLSSGYDVGGLFGLHFALPNLTRYPALLTAMQTPLVWLAFLAPWLLHRRGEPLAPAVVAVGFGGAVFASYLFYPGFDAHETLRFLVPALPALFVLLGVVLALATAMLRPVWRVAVLVAIVGLIGARGVSYAKANWAFNNYGERRFEVIGKAIAQRLPENAVVLSMQHSGSVRYYSGRDIVRYDLVPRHRLDRLVKRLQRIGRHPYIVLDAWEVDEYRRRYEGSSLLAALDWPPLYELEHVEVRVWDALDRARRVPSRTRDTEILPWPYPR